MNRKASVKFKDVSEVMKSRDGTEICLFHRFRNRWSMSREAREREGGGGGGGVCILAPSTGLKTIENPSTQKRLN